MSSNPLKRRLRLRKILNYMDMYNSSLSDQNDSNVSDQNVSVSGRKTRVTRKTSVLTAQNQSNISIENDPDYSSNESADDSDSDGLFSKKMKIDSDVLHARRASVTLKRVSASEAPTSARLDNISDLAGILSAAGDEDDANEYRRERQKQMLDRQMVLKSIDFDEGLEEFKTLAKSIPVAEPSRKILKPAPKRVNVKRDIIIQRRSERIQNRSIDLSNDNEDGQSTRRSSRLNAVNILSCNEVGDDSQSTSLGDKSDIDENLKMVTEEENEFLESLKDAINVPYDSVSDFTICDFDKFKETLKQCYMFNEPAKLIESRVVSMDFHPSEKKLLLLIGDKHGHVALRDLVTYDGIQIKGHQYNVNCVKFSLQNTSKFYSASLDGTVRIGDINSSTLNLLYTSDYHTTWHHESGDTLYIAEGDGSVRVLDLRSPNDNPPIFRCHQRSVRTVQTHPLNENYFLTSSGIGCFGVWDVRHIKAAEPEPIITETFPRALTSAFYSPKGNYVLTTCNDDTIRVFDIADNQPKEISRINHNNHTGRWLSVFKAMWQPNREDCYYVGSMMQPRRIQAYTQKGVPIREFRSDEMATVNAVITVHPTKPIIVGGNSSGKIHIFSPFRDLSDI